jgi:hypothetical protein
LQGSGARNGNVGLGISGHQWKLPSRFDETPTSVEFSWTFVALGSADRLTVRGIAATYFRTMELITILNRCHRFRGFVYNHAHFGADKKSIEVAVRLRRGSAAVCSRCHSPAPDYDQFAERRFEFIPLWGFSVNACIRTG